MQPEETLVYRPLPAAENKEEIQRILREGARDDLMLLSLSVGESFPDWKYAQDVCLALAASEDASVRANACLGLAYVARTKGKLEKHLVKPVLLRELRTQKELKWRIQDAIEDINQYLGWKLAHKHADDDESGQS